MSVFVDTSAFLSILDGDDAHHPATAKVWGELLAADTLLVTSNYVLVETAALVQSRLGPAASRAFHQDLWPILHIEWVDAKVHAAATVILLSAERRKLSLVDCVSFEIMRLHQIDTAFTFDRHFREQGFVCLPGVAAGKSVPNGFPSP